MKTPAFAFEIFAIEQNGHVSKKLFHCFEWEVSCLLVSNTGSYFIEFKKYEPKTAKQVLESYYTKSFNIIEV